MEPRKVLVIGMDSVTYLRKWPWRPRSSWRGNGVGARRRGFRQDALCPPPETLDDGVDLVMSVTSAATPSDDIVVARVIDEPAAPRAVAARVDVSGLLAIASSAPEPVSLSRRDDAPLDAGWHAYGDRGDEESLLARNSA